MPLHTIPGDVRKTIAAGNRSLRDGVQLVPAMMSVRFFSRLVCALLLGWVAPPVLQGQEWNCIQVLNDGTVDLNWEPDVAGAATYSVVPLLPPPDYTPLPASVQQSGSASSATANKGTGKGKSRRRGRRSGGPKTIRAEGHARAAG